jgi:hypothetical protein
MAMDNVYSWRERETETETEREIVAIETVIDLYRLVNMYMFLGSVS